jgi:hypothetical protein
MPRTTTVLALAAMAALVATGGCLDEGPTQDGESTTSSSSSPPTPAPAASCDADAPLPLLPSWAGHGGSWAGFVQADPAHPDGIRGQGDPAEPGLSLLVDHGQQSVPAIVVEVDLALVSGEHPDGAGVAFHWTGASYNIVRYSPSEGGWHLFTVIDGNRTKIDPVPLDVQRTVDLCQWVQLRVVADGLDVQAYQDGHLILEATLPDAASACGQAGLFLRGNTVALFDDYATRSP